VDEIMMQPGVDGTVDLSAAGQGKRNRTDEPWEAVTGKRIRKAVHDPQGNEYVLEMKGHSECT
jgi:hypothetical protein